MFVDEAKIHVASGRGGDGVVHFRREKYVPRGGPDGGDGGRGGDVVFEVDPHLNSLHPFRRQRHFHAEDGGRGGGGNRTGADGDDILVRVPPGTLVKDAETGELLADLTDPDDRVKLLEGGRGGRGNARFASSRKQAPRVAERGAPGEERWVRLELQLIADVGIIGVPNAGKSTLLSAVSNAKPKIADYPFTTLVPNLGVVELDPEVSLVLADIPGLIEGAHEGTGLGFEFLRHIKRTRALIHLLDGMAEDPLADYGQVNSEMALYDERLTRLPQIVAVNKVDMPEVEARWPDLQRALQERGVEAMAVSAIAQQGVRELMYKAHEAAQSWTPEPATEAEDELPIYKSEFEDTQFVISRDPDGAWRVAGEKVERAAEMTYWEYPEAVRRFQRLLEKIGVEAALRERGVQEDDTVRIGDFELEWRE